LNQARKLENLNKEVQKNTVSVTGVSEVQWKGLGEIRSGGNTVHHSRGESPQQAVAIVVHRSKARSIVKKIVCNNRTSKYFDSAKVHANIKVRR
jgi:nitrogen regulatory protein PII